MFCCALKVVIAKHKALFFFQEDERAKSRKREGRKKGMDWIDV